jgi:hypothetical protein
MATLIQKTRSSGKLLYSPDMIVVRDLPKDGVL